MTTAAADEPGLEYTRRLYANVLAWYDNADKKAQLILTANGGFLTVLTGFALSSPGEVRETVGVFGPETWLLAGLAATGVLISFASAALALWSRLLSAGDAAEIFERQGVKLGDPTTYDPAILWFFQLVQHLDESALERRLHAFSAQQEIDAMVDQVIQLSQRVTKKHLWVNVGFVATTVGLSCLLATAVSYAIRLGV